ncbi:hypothetical protein ACF0H5_009361 [Mactra antiquata]
MNIVQENLNNVRDEWNTHILQSKRDGIGGGRRPILLYTAPSIFDANDYLCATDDNEIKVCSEQTIPKPTFCADKTVLELSTLYMDEHGILGPTNVAEAKDLYIHLRQSIRDQLDLI